MFDAQLLFPGSSPETGIIIFSPWFPRGGDHLRATLEVAQINGATIKVEVFTKNTEDGGDGQDADNTFGTNITTNVIGRTTQEWYSSGNIALKELVRYRYTVTGSNVSDWVLFRMLAPIWFDAVKG